MNKKTLIICLLALCSVMGCGKNKPAPKQKEVTTITLNDKPKEIPGLGSLSKDEDKMRVFGSISTVYILASDVQSPFQPKYRNAYKVVKPFVGKMPPKKIEKALEALARYVRDEKSEKEEKEEKSVSTHVEVIKKHHLGVSFASLCVPLAVETDKESHAYFEEPVYNFVYAVKDYSSAHNSTLSLADMFRKRNKDGDASIPVEDLISFVEPPQHITLVAKSNLHGNGVKVSDTLTLPAVCTDKDDDKSTVDGKEEKYKLVAALRKLEVVAGDPSADEATGTTSIKGATYFRWGSKWFKITPDKMSPESVELSKIQEAIDAEKNNVNKWEFIYRKEVATQ